MTKATSPYLNRECRSYRDAVQDISQRRDYQPDLKFFGDTLQQGEHKAIASASFLRREVRRVVEGMKADHWERNCPVCRKENIAWLREARKAHSRAILNRQAYRAAINEREIQRSLGLS